MSDVELKSGSVARDGVRLAYVEAGADRAAPPLVFVHGWAGDHVAQLPQMQHFAHTRRVVAVHLRGHGDSDRPQQDYTMAGFADDIAFQCDQLGLRKPVVIGHSLGGAVALELAGRYPALTSGIVLIDSIVFPRPDAVEPLRAMADGVRTDFLAVARQSAEELQLDYRDPDDLGQRQRILTQICSAHRKTAPHAALSVFETLLRSHDPSLAAKACSVPVAYIAAGVPLVEMASDYERFRAACPQVMMARTLGAGHFSPLEVPEQINAMIGRFLAVGIVR